MKKVLSAIILVVLTMPAIAQEIEKWGRFEVAYEANVKGNPFDVVLTATFTNGGESTTVTGFYDGDGRYFVRFMPDKEGRWTFITRSKVGALNGKKGSFTCITPSEGNHGPVSAAGPDFKYADGTWYYPVGTTSYSWMHAPEGYPERTLKSLEESGFNKIRCLFFPQNISYDYDGPYPFEKKADGSWNFERFNPEYFREVETYTDKLRDLGIECDLILFHPYDGGKWGFDRMPLEVNLRYLRYIAARMGSFRNVWWSLANEWDGLRRIPAEDWEKFGECVAESDPYDHLLSVHGYTATYYPYWKPWVTHCSIQDQAPVEGPGRAGTVRNIYKKPVVFDEICYEGNLVARWGNLSGEEELYRMWNALIAGTYATHAECLNLDGNGKSEQSTNYLAFGGDFHGESWKRIKLMRSILEELPHPLYLADKSWDTSFAGAGDGYYLLYFGKEMKDEWVFDIPTKNLNFARPQKGEKFQVDIIDTWDMTITTWPVTFELGDPTPGNYRFMDVQHRSVRLPLKPYILLRIRKI